MRLIESETETKLLDTNNDSTDGLAVRLVVSELQVVVAVVVHVDVELTLLRVVQFVDLNATEFTVPCVDPDEIIPGAVMRIFG